MRVVLALASLLILAVTLRGSCRKTYVAELASTPNNAHGQLLTIAVNGPPNYVQALPYEKRVLVIRADQGLEQSRVSTFVACGAAAIAVTGAAAGDC